ncbi:hypothetical protein LIN78_11000 [Leeia sp. TBRC 13508]|uniref:Tryptophan synthase subunit beta like protein n=1 Tax=Leeia speluncae TaxID=2884804 RepID=A0ABS8D7A3_9NEIS|nr:hypothetical protein [Leeia speluncae]MCB6184073.1 hypothetical protein [Leeia speluncae]
MPYVKRDDSGEVIAIFKQATPEANEFLPQHSPEIARFLGQNEDSTLFTGLDNELVRVLEDLVDTLITKNLLRITDLPSEAQQKLLARKRLRNQLGNRLTGLLGSDDDLI